MTPRAPGSPSRRRWLIGFAAALVALAYVAVAAFHIAYGAMNVDEGFYAAATRAVWQGELPYRDFGFSQTPLVPVINAPALGAIGFGLFEQRIVNGLWGALALVLTLRLVSRRCGPGWALFLALVFALSPVWMYFTHLGKTYALTSLLAMAASTVFIEGKPGWKKIVALSCLGVLGVGCRLPAAPFFGALWLAALWHGGAPDVRRLVIAFGSLVTFTAIVLLPFYLIAPEPSTFWVVELHRVVSVLRDWRLRWNELVTVAPAVWTLAVGALGLVVIARRQWRQREVAVIAAAALALAANLLPRGVYEEYGVPFLLPLATASLVLLGPQLAAWSRRKLALTAIALLAAPFALAPALNWRQLQPDQRTLPSVWLPINTRPYNFELPDNIARASEAVNRLLPSGEPFIGPPVILAVETGHPIPRKLRMGAFTMTSDYPREQADRLHLLTYGEFEKQLRDIDLPMVVLHKYPAFNYGWSMPSFRIQTDEERHEWLGILQRYFVVFYEDADFVILTRPHLIPLLGR